MSAAAFAAVAPLQVELFREHLVALFVKVKIFRFFDGGFLHKLKLVWNFYFYGMIIVAHFLLKNSKINAITLFPFILLSSPKDRDNAVLLRHEKIHLRQQAELLILFFYFWYVGEYFYHYLKLRNGYAAYRRISFEREAYAMESNTSYLTTRRFWGFWKYLQ